MNEAATFDLLGVSVLAAQTPIRGGWKPGPAGGFTYLCGSGRGNSSIPIVPISSGRRLGPQGRELTPFIRSNGTMYS